MLKDKLKVTKAGHHILARADRNNKSEVVLCYLPHNDLTPFASWCMDTVTGETFWGHYYVDLEEALEGYKARVAPR